jgi:hypothetical protein
MVGNDVVNWWDRLGLACAQCGSNAGNVHGTIHNPGCPLLGENYNPPSGDWASSQIDLNTVPTGVDSRGVVTMSPPSSMPNSANGMGLVDWFLALFSPNNSQKNKSAKKM